MNPYRFKRTQQFGTQKTRVEAKRKKRVRTDVGFRMDGPFWVDSVLPAQVTNGRVTDSQPERHLMLAVLEDALRVLEKYAGARTEVRLVWRTAWEWAVEDFDISHPFSFIPLCDACGIDPDWLREKIRQMVARKRGQIVAAQQVMREVRVRDLTASMRDSILDLRRKP